MTEHFGRYQILNKIATGGMAEVFKAKITGEKGFEKLVVIKKVLPHLADENKWIMHFTDEAKLAALLQHENIIHVYDSGKIGDTWYIAMEYLDGMDLKSVITASLAQAKPLETGRVLHIMKGICDGLDYAHALTDYQGNHLHIIHRDISPQNIFITFDGKVKIIDFGIAKAEERSVKTQVGTIKGKLAYMAPEHAQGKPIDHRSDIFAAGILFYEMLTGKRMYPGDMADILMKVVRAEFPPAADILPDCPAGVLDILEKALAKNPDDRYATAGGMAADIEDGLYALDLRVGARHLAAYMKELFPDQRTKEVEALTTLDFTQNEEQPFEKTTAVESQRKDPTAKTVEDDQPSAPRFAADNMAERFHTLKQHLADRMLSRKGLPQRFQAIKRTVVARKPVTKIAAGALLVVLAVTGMIMHSRKTDARISALLETARQRLEAKSYTTPQDDSAAHYYREVLELDDGNEEALQGIKAIVDQKIERAEMMLARFRQQSALLEIHDGLLLEPDNERLLELKQEAGKKVSDRVFGGFKSLFKSKDESKETPEDVDTSDP